MKSKIVILLRFLFTILLIMIILAYMLINYYPQFKPTNFYLISLSKFVKTDKGVAVFIVIPIFLLVRGELKNMLSNIDTKGVEEDSIEVKT